MGDIRLIEIDDSNRSDHFHLTGEDHCYFLYEYAARKGYSFSETNQLISNLKKKPSENWKNGYHHKGRAITKAAGALKAVLAPAWLQTSTIVPVPSSKATGHPDYDDRLTRIAKAIPAPDVRELVINTQSHEAAHESEHRPTVDELIARYQINEALAFPEPVSIGIFDDVLTAGTHYRAMEHVLSQRFPKAMIMGIFIARRVLPNPFAELGPVDPDWF